VTRPHIETTMKPPAWLRLSLASFTLLAFALALPVRAHAVPRSGTATTTSAGSPSTDGGANQTSSPYGVAAAAACGAMIWLTGATGGTVPATWVGATAACLFVIFDAFFID